jgi:hypothetical protein
MIPEHLRWLFWDTDVRSLSPGEYPEYCITRALELGDELAVQWMRETFSESQIKDVLGRQHRLSRRSAHFWSLVYGLQPDQVAALQNVNSD